MKNRKNQIYEDYWSYTAAFTDMNGNKFISVLKTCINFLNKHKDEAYSEANYEELQEEVMRSSGITGPSVRKAINQLVKLGFLKPFLKGYVPEAVEYVNAVTDRKRQNLLSKIVYRYCNFNNSMTEPNANGQGQINFFLKTLEEVGAIDNSALVALMSVDINKYPKGYLNKEELDNVFYSAYQNGFISRKYNQISHLKNLLKRLDDLQVHDNSIYFKTDAERLFGDDEETKKAVRDPYLQRVYKTELEEVSKQYFQSNAPKCMLEGLAYPVLIASHIKPYIKSNDDEAFDVDNGLLLSKNTDSLFDLGYMTFDDNGIIIPSKILDDDIKAYLAKFRLAKEFRNAKRMAYMDYHRKYVFEKRYSTGNVKKYVFSGIQNQK